MLVGLATLVAARPTPLLSRSPLLKPDDDADLEATTPRARRTALSVLSPSKRREAALEDKLAFKNAEIQYYEQILAGHM